MRCHATHLAPEYPWRCPLGHPMGRVVAPPAVDSCPRLHEGDILRCAICQKGGAVGLFAADVWAGTADTTATVSGESTAIDLAAQLVRSLTPTSNELERDAARELFRLARSEDGHARSAMLLLGRALEELRLASVDRQRLIDMLYRAASAKS